MTKTLFVGNLPWSASDEELKERFEEVAPVSSARVVTDRTTGKSRGFGFVEVSEELADSVIRSMDQSQWDGRQIRVSEAQPRQSGWDRRGSGGFQRRRF
ncbi:MAG: RNA recognition motif domain-containing protein [Bacillota bacterium]